MTDAQRQAIGKLTSDVGICCNMKYKSGGSSAGGHRLAHVFTNHFGYASAQVAQWQTDQSRSADVKKALLSNFDAGLPVALGLDGDDGGHEIVGDGYGYSDGTLYIHFNMGWGGTDNAWYAPPAMDTTQFNFSVLDGVVYNVFTNQPLNTVICSGRVLDASGIPVENATVTAKRRGTSTIVKSVTANARGVYALTLPAAAYTITAASGGTSASVDVTLSENVSIEYSPSGGYWNYPEPQVNNMCENDIVLTGIASVEEPQFTPSSCLFYPSTNVTISCATAGATIRYTLDGTDPTESSATYTGPILVNDDATIKARAWKSGMNPSVIVDATYTYDAAQGAPKGDYFANPIVITGANGSRTIEDNSAYTVEPDEPHHMLENGSAYSQYHTIWYEWTAPGSGTMNSRLKCHIITGVLLWPSIRVILSHQCGVLRTPTPGIHQMIIEQVFRLQ